MTTKHYWILACLGTVIGLVLFGAMVKAMIFPSPVPPPIPPTPSNLRVLFLYDPLTLIDMPPAQQAILASPESVSYTHLTLPTILRV